MVTFHAVQGKSYEFDMLEYSAVCTGICLQFFLNYSLALQQPEGQ